MSKPCSTSSSGSSFRIPDERGDLVDQNLAILALFAFAYSLISGRLDRTPVNGPVVYLLFGVFLGPVGLGWLDLPLGGEAIRSIAELTLALVLFTDAANADLRVLQRARRLPERLLLAGLPLTILLGMGSGVLLFPELGFLEIAILATMLAPTDAALGKAVVTNPAVPAPIREGLNVESGLNDGICVPILFTFLALASHSGGDEGAGRLALELVLEQIGIGAAVGAALAVAGAWGLRTASTRGWLLEHWLGIPVVALALGSFGLAQHAGVIIPSRVEHETARDKRDRLYEINAAAAKYFPAYGKVKNNAGIVFKALTGSQVYRIFTAHIFQKLNDANKVIQ